MKIYEWKETETHYIAYMRPKELFDLSTMQKPNPEDHEARLLAKHIFTGEMEGFALRELMVKVGGKILQKRMPIV
ncbi:MAG: hypothetical protein AB9903_28275 [Vulcanimicrobiota bacterium]